MVPEDLHHRPNTGQAATITLLELLLPGKHDCPPCDDIAANRRCTASLTSDQTLSQFLKKPAVQSCIPGDHAVQLLASCCQSTVLKAAPPGLQPRFVQLHGVSLKLSSYFTNFAGLCLPTLAIEDAPGRPAVQQLADAQPHFGNGF